MYVSSFQNKNSENWNFYFNNSTIYVFNHTTQINEIITYRRYASFINKIKHHIKYIVIDFRGAVWLFLSKIEKSCSKVENSHL